MAMVEEALFREFEDLFENLKKTSQKPDALKGGAAGDDRPVLDDLFYALQCKIDGLLGLVQPENEGYVKLLAMKASLHYEDAKVKLSVDDFLGSRT